MQSLSRQAFRTSTVTLLALMFVMACRPAQGEVNPNDRAMADEVFAQLLSVAPVPNDMAWPPRLQIVDQDQINAFATIIKREGQEAPIVVCYTGLLTRTIQGNPDRLAYVLGHELSHHLLGHTRVVVGDTDFERTTFTRDQEIAADRRGIELALRANFSFQGGMSAIHRMIELGLNYSSFEGLGVDHPSWVDRIALLDKNQASLWRSMSAFYNGNYFLVAQNYAVAERAFRQVTKEFPDAYEAWANLGYALLMEYADSLDPEDVRRFDVGQIVVGGFYRRPQSLESKVRGINEEMWWDAVGALREAIRLNPQLSLPKANLGIAYLFRPAGKDAGKAAQLLEEAAMLSNTDPSLDPLSRLTEQMNLAVAYASAGDGGRAMTVLGNLETSLRQGPAGKVPGSASLINAILYNRALLLAQYPDNGRQRQAMSDLENYLSRTPESLAWWPLAYRRYVTLCQQFGVAPKADTVFESQLTPRFRPVAALELAHGQIALGENLTDAKKQLGGPGTTISLVRGTNLTAVNYSGQGVRLVAGDQVLAIMLAGAQAPTIPVRERGLSTRAQELRVGMSSSDLDRVLGDSDYDFRQLVDPEEFYRFYTDLGVAIRVDNGQVTEMVIGQIPRRHTAF